MDRHGWEWPHWPNFIRFLAIHQLITNIALNMFLNRNELEIFIPVLLSSRNSCTHSVTRSSTITEKNSLRITHAPQVNVWQCRLLSSLTYVMSGDMQRNWTQSIWHVNVLWHDENWRTYVGKKSCLCENEFLSLVIPAAYGARASTNLKRHFNASGVLPLRSKSNSSETEIRRNTGWKFPAPNRLFRKLNQENAHKRVRR